MRAADDWFRLGRLLDPDPSVATSARPSAAGGGSRDAVVDALDEAGSLAYLRTGDTGMELVDALAELPRVRGSSVDLGRATDEDDLSKAVLIAGAALAAVGLRLARIEEDEDAVALVVVDADDLPEIVDLSRLVGFPLAVIDSQPAASRARSSS